MAVVAYVTKATYKKLAGTWVRPDHHISVDQIFSVLFEQSLQPILNTNEAFKLYSLQQMLAGAMSSLQAIRPYHSKRYIFDTNFPKFHKNRDCDFLQSDFKNYLVPPEIEALGPDTVAAFRSYCTENKQYYEGKTDDIFWAHVGAYFHVHVSPQAVIYDNSGVQDVTKMTIDDLKRKIDESFSQCLTMIDSERSGRAIKGVRYAPHVDTVLGQISDETLKESVKTFFTLKRTIIETLFDLYAKEAHEDGYVLPVDLMTSIGLEPCKGCWR